MKIAFRLFYCAVIVSCVLIFVSESGKWARIQHLEHVRNMELKRQQFAEQQTRYYRELSDAINHRP